MTSEEKSARDEATMAEHKSHIEFENELYATLVDPLADGPIKEAEMRKQLMESARWYRQHVYDLETQLNGRAEHDRAVRIDELQVIRGSCPAEFRDYVERRIRMLASATEAQP